MITPNALAAHAFRGLVERVGGVDAAVAVITARRGEPMSKGTISRYCNGENPVSLEAAIMLEDAAGVTPITAMMTARLADGEIDGLEAFARIAELNGQLVALFARSMERGGPDDDLSMSPRLAAEVVGPTSELANLLAGLAHKARLCAEGA